MTEGRLENLSLSRIAEGAIEVRFAEALSKILENIGDINTEAKKERSITITVRFFPTENRDMGRVLIDEPTVKLVKRLPDETQIFIGKVGDQMQAQEFRQMTIFDSPAKTKTESIK